MHSYLIAVAAFGLALANPFPDSPEAARKQPTCDKYNLKSLCCVGATATPINPSYTPYFPGGGDWYGTVTQCVTWTKACKGTIWCCKGLDTDSNQGQTCTKDVKHKTWTIPTPPDTPTPNQQQQNNQRKIPACPAGLTILQRRDSEEVDGTEDIALDCIPQPQGETPNRPPLGSLSTEQDGQAVVALLEEDPLNWD